MSIEVAIASFGRRRRPADWHIPLVYLSRLEPPLHSPLPPNSFPQLARPKILAAVLAFVISGETHRRRRSLSSPSFFSQLNYTSCAQELKETFHSPEDPDLKP